MMTEVPPDPGVTRKRETPTQTYTGTRDSATKARIRFVLGSRGCLQALGSSHLITMPIPICLLVTPACCQESLYF